MLKYGLFAVALVAQPALAEDAKLSGFRLEVRAGYETPTVSNGSVYKLGNSVSGGAEAGFDLPVSRSVTAGPFVNYDYASAETCGAGYCLGSDGNLAAGGRIGFNVGGKTQIYAKVAYDRFRLKASIPGFTGTKNLTGVQGAIGVDFNITKAAYAGFEIDYADLGNFAGVNFQRRHVAATLGLRF